MSADREELRGLGASNFGYCVDIAADLLGQNRNLLAAIRDLVRTRMSNFRDCKVTRGGTHIILAKGSEIDNLYRGLGFRISIPLLDLSIASEVESSRTN